MAARRSLWHGIRFIASVHFHRSARRSFLASAFWLTIYSLVFDVMRWIFDFKEGQVRIPIALILYALFIWRLHLARRTVAAERHVVAV